MSVCVCLILMFLQNTNTHLYICFLIRFTTGCLKDGVRYEVSIQYIISIHLFHIRMRNTVNTYCAKKKYQIGNDCSVNRL